MTKGPHRETTRRIVLKERIEHVLSEQPAIELVLSDGTEITIPPKSLWPDAVMEKAQTEDYLGMAKGLIGPAAYASFVADGGTAILLLEMAGEDQGVSVGESSAS